MFARFLPFVVLTASFPGLAAEPGETYDYSTDFEYDYVLGFDDAGKAITGGAHYVVRYDNRREAIDYQNTATKLHPALTGTYLKFDASRTAGTSDWDVFASNWWPQSKNGVAWRWNGGGQNYSNHGDVDHLSPIEKYDLLFNPGQAQTVAAVDHWNYDELDTPQAERGPKHNHPQVQALGPATKWELTNHGQYQQGYHPEGWWGHCNGWASYVTAEEGGAPQRDIRVKVVNGQVRECATSESGCTLFRMGDIEALMGELYFNDTATFAGRRCQTANGDMDFDEYGRPTDVSCRDINAGTFHIAVVGLLNRGADHLATGQAGHPPFVIDYSYDYQVWNYPLTKYVINDTEVVTEAEAAALVGANSDYVWNASATKFVRVDMTYYMVSDSVGVSAMLLRADQRGISLDANDIHYVLELDANDNILGGEWIKDPETSWGTDSKTKHPDFLWMASDPQGYYENGDDTGGSSDNPYLAYPDVRMLLDCANDASTCDDDTTDPGGDDTGDPADTDDPNGTSPGNGIPDCGGCAGSFHGPSPFVMSVFGSFGFFLRRRRFKLPSLLGL